MKYTPPAKFLTRSHPRRVAGAQLWCLGAWLLLLTGVMAQTSDSSTTDTTTTTSGVLFISGGTISGSTITLNNSTTLAGSGPLTLAGSNMLTTASSAATFTTLPAGMVLDTTTTNVAATATTINVTPPLDSSSLSSSLTLSGSTNYVSNVYTGATISLVNNVSNTLNISNLTDGLVKTGAATLTLSNPVTIYTGSSQQTTTTPTTIVLYDTSTNTAASMLSSIGTLPSSGTLIINSGGVFNLGSISASGLTLVGSTSLTAAGGTILGNTGLALTTSGTTSQYSSSINVAALGSTPVGKPSTSSSFANAVVSLVGVGNVNGQSIAERGVIYSQTTVNSTPSMGAAGVTKIALSSQPNSAGSFSLPTGGLAPSTTYAYRVYAIDSAGNTYLSGTSAFTTPTVLQNWRQTFFGTTQGKDTAADNADPDGDGVPNLVEFATGKNPTSAGSAASSSTSIGSSGSLEYTYSRSLDAVNSGTTFVVEWNDTLDPAQWSSAGVTETVLSDNGLIQQVKATMPAGATGRRFVHLKVVPPAAQ